MKEFFQKVWVRIIAWIFIVIGTLVLLLGGTEVGDIVRVPELVFGIVEAVGVLILFIRGLLLKKDSANK
jgi:hypothetical protein